MYYWKTKALRDELLDGKINQEKQMHYLLATMILYLMGYSDAITASNGALLIEFLLLLIVTIAGIRFCYRANVSGGHQDFIARFTCLSFPVTIKMISLIFFVALIIEPLVAGSTSLNADKSLIGNEYADILILVLLEIIYFWRISVHLRYTSIESAEK
jgi:hypothetical protein